MTLRCTAPETNRQFFCSLEKTPRLFKRLLMSHDSCTERETPWFAPDTSFPSSLTSQTSLSSSSNLFLWPAPELLCLRGSLLYCSEESWNDRLGWLQILESSCSCKWIKADWNPILGCCHCRFSCKCGFTLWLWLRAAVISSLPSAPLNPISFCRHSISATTFHLLWFSLKINHTIHARGDPMSFLGTLTPFA